MILCITDRVPRPPLDSFVESIWVYQNDPRPHALERILPTGAAQLIVNLKEDQTRLYDPEFPHRWVATSGSVLSGVQSRFQVIDTSEQEYVAGVAFKPGGTVPFMRVPAHEASDADIPLEALWGAVVRPTLRERLLDGSSVDAKLDALEAALHEMWTPLGLHPAVTFALAAFDRVPTTTSIAAVTDAIGLSAKRFIERFKIEVGMTPKRYCRDSSIPARPGAGESGPSCRLDAGGAGLRLLRSGALHSRLPIVRGSHADRVSVGSDVVSEPRQISTIRRRTASETMTPWLIRKTPIARSRPTSWCPMRMPNSHS